MRPNTSGIPKNYIRSENVAYPTELIFKTEPILPRRNNERAGDGRAKTADAAANASATAAATAAVAATATVRWHRDWWHRGW